MRKSKTESNINEIILVAKLNLVLDLDNTIILCEHYDKEKEKEVIEKIEKNEKLLNRYKILTKFEDSVNIYYIYERPHLNYLIMSLSKYYNLYVYTNAHRKYCENILSALAKKYKMIEICAYNCKESVSQTNIKKLNNLDITTGHLIDKFGHYLNTIIIDDRKEFWPYDIKNLIHCKPYDEIDLDDRELIYITDNLIFLSDEFDKKTQKHPLVNIQVLLNKIK